MTAYLDFSADCILKPVWKKGRNVHVMLMVFSKIKEVFILGDKINISLGEIVLDICAAHCMASRIPNPEFRTTRNKEEDWFKVGISKNSKFVIEDFVKPCGGEKLKILTFPSAKPTASIWG